jgi:hypothetical protein
MTIAWCGVDRLFVPVTVGDTAARRYALD